jgi:hypothetical protein
VIDNRPKFPCQRWRCIAEAEKVITLTPYDPTTSSVEPTSTTATSSTTSPATPIETVVTNLLRIPTSSLLTDQITSHEEETHIDKTALIAALIVLVVIILVCILVIIFCQSLSYFYYL